MVWKCVGSKINRLLDDHVEQLSALCVGRHKAQISLQQKIKSLLLGFTSVLHLGFSHRIEHQMLNAFFFFYQLLTSFLSWNESKKLSVLVLLYFRAVQNTSACSGILLKKYLPGLGSFLWTLKCAHFYFWEPLHFLDEQTGKAAFTGWPPVLIFSKEQEKEKRVYVCGRER